MNRFFGKRNFWILLCFCLSNNIARSSDNASDSLLNLVPQRSGAKLADLYLDIALAIYRETGNIDTLLHYSNIALTESEKAGAIQEQVYAYKFISTAYALSANYESSNINLERALRLAHTIRDTSSIADINNKFGYNCQMQNQTERALFFYIEAAKTFEAQRNWDELSVVYLNISTIFSALKRTDEMKLYITKMLKLVGKLTDPYNKVTMLSAAANYYAEFSATDSTYSDSALFCAKQGLTLGEANKFYNKCGEIYVAIGLVYEIKKEFENCIAHNLNALHYRKHIREGVIYAAMKGLQIAYMETKQWAPSLVYLDSMNMLDVTHSYVTYEMGFQEASYKLYKITGKDTEALQALEKFKYLEDSLMGVERTAKISELEQQYNKVKNEKIILELNQSNQIIVQKNEIQTLRITQLFFGVALLLLILFFGAYLFWQSNKNKKRKLLDIEQRLNRARMNPHFVFNVLAALQSLALDEKRNHEVPAYISRFSKIMRQSLESTFTEFTTLEEEIEFLTDYLELQKLLTGNRFDYSVNIDKSIEAFEVNIPGMIIQPFIENAIEHGFRGYESGGEIKLVIKKTNENLLIQIEDNGKSVSAVKENKQYPSRATQIITDRLFLLKKKTGKKANYKLSHTESGGILVEIFLPLLYIE